MGKTEYRPTEHDIHRLKAIARLSGWNPCQDHFHLPHITLYLRKTRCEIATNNRYLKFKSFDHAARVIIDTPTKRSAYI